MVVILAKTLHRPKTEVQNMVGMSLIKAKKHMLKEAETPNLLRVIKRGIKSVFVQYLSKKSEPTMLNRYMEVKPRRGPNFA